jgi:collagen type III alpha
MATLLDAPKPAPKLEEYVEKQLTAARRRVRLLDAFLVGLTVAVASLLFSLGLLMVDRYVETPTGLGWAAVVGWVGLMAAFVYVKLFHPTRREINPYFAARQVEQVVPDAKNSLVTFVDFEEDPKLPPSIRTAISQKAARDLKKVDLNRAIENRRIIWLGIAAGIFLLANVVVAFLPPTRTELTLQEPKTGDITVFNNQDVSFQVKVHGRVPGPNDADAVRLRMWYNPDDPDTYEDRPLRQIEGDRRQFELTVPAKQVRNGFHYRVLAGKTQTPEYTVTCKIIPEFTGFDVSYEYPAYLKREPEQNNDPNLVGPFGTVVTLIATANREIKHGHIEIEGSPRTIDGKLVEGRPDAIQFTLPLEKDGFFRVHFTTPEGDKNQDPARLRLTVIDPKPAFRSFDIAYDYPAYLRFKPMVAADVREPLIEGPRGSKVVLTAKTTRAVREAKLELEGQPPIVGEPIPDQPMWVRFKLPALDKDGVAKVTFTPTTDEGPSAPRSIPIRALVDQAPFVEIRQPQEDETTLPANGTLELKGLATDDHGVDKLTLRMKVVGAEDRDIKAKPYRGGMSFLRKDDNSWPTVVEYKDFVKLPDLRLEKDQHWRATAGTIIEYWLEAEDNCAVPPGPNRGESKHKRLKVTAPAVKPEEQKKIDNQTKKAAQEQKRHEQQQDEKNQTEKRDVQQPPPQGADNPQQDNNTGDRRPGDPKQDPMNNAGQPERKQDATGEPQKGMPPQEGDPNDARNRQVDKAIQQGEQEKDPGGAKSGPNKAAPDAKVEPGDKRPEGKGPTDPPETGDRTPKTDPNQDMKGDGPAGAARSGNVDKMPEDKGDAKDEGAAPMAGTPPTEKGGEKRSYGGNKDEYPPADKPAPKDPPMGGTPAKDGADKGEARPEPKPSGDPMDPSAGQKTAKGGAKPDKEVTPAEDKKGSSEPGPMGDKPPSDVAGDKPEKAPEPGGTRQKPKDDQAADAGGSRTGPKDNDGTAGDKRPEPKKTDGTQDETAKGGTKGGPGAPQNDKTGEQGELDRDFGQLDQDINSPNPKLDPKRKSDVERLMRNRDTREQTRKKLDELERNAKDQLTRDKARQAREAGERAAEDYEKEKPTPENVDKLSKKLDSQDERERKEAENRLKDWQNDAQAKKDLDEEVDQLKKKDRNAGERVQDAMQKNDQANKQPGGANDQRLDEKDLQKMARDLNGSDEKAKADAQKNLERMMQDPKTRQQAQDKLRDMAKKAEGQDKQNLQDAADKADQLAKKQPGGNPEQKLDPQALKDAAEKLANGTEKEKQEARDQLDKMMKDPKAAAEAQKQLQDMAKNAKTPEQKEALEKAAEKAGEMAKKQPGGTQDQKLDPQALKDAAEKLANGTEKEKQEARDQFDKMMKDPKTAAEAQSQLQDMAKNAKTPEQKEALEKAAEKAGEMAKGQTPKVDPKDLADTAKKLANGTPEEKERAKQQLKDMMKDPKAAEQAKDMLKDMANQAKTPEDKKALQDAANEAEKLAKEMGPKDKPDPKDLKDLADKMAGNDPKAKQEAQDKLKDMMKDPKARDEALKQLNEMAKNAKPEDKKALEDALKQANEMAKNQPQPDPKDLAEMAKQLDKLDPEAKENLRKQLEEAMKDPKVREEMKKKAEEFAKQPKTPQEQKNFDDLMKQLAGKWPDFDIKPIEADPRHRLRTMELRLDKFQKDKSIPDRLNWTQEEIDKWVKDQQTAITELRKQLEKDDWQRDRTAVSPIRTGPEAVQLNPKGSSDGNKGTRVAPPSGYGDPYKRFTTEQPGGRPGEPKR